MHIRHYAPCAHYENADSAEIVRRVREMDLWASASKHALGAHHDPIISPIVGSILTAAFGAVPAAVQGIVTALVTTAAVGGIQIIDKRPK